MLGFFVTIMVFKIVTPKTLILQWKIDYVTIVTIIFKVNYRMYIFFVYLMIAEKH